MTHRSMNSRILVHIFHYCGIKIVSIMWYGISVYISWNRIDSVIQNSTNQQKLSQGLCVKTRFSLDKLCLPGGVFCPIIAKMERVSGCKIW